MNTLNITSAEEFSAAVSEHSQLLVDFFKDDCPGCKMLELSLGKFSNSDAAEGITLAKVKLEEIGEEFFFSHRLRQTPTLLFFRDGEEAGRSAGFVPPEKIEALVKETA